MCISGGMTPRRLTFLGAVALVVAGLGAVPADGKFRMTLKLEPARPVAGDPARVTIRTDEALPMKHGIRLHAVGPWRTRYGQALVEIRLRRLSPTTLQGAVRFPYAGRWHLDIPASLASPPLDRWVRVRPRP
jgi:hypothetical protein